MKMRVIIKRRVQMNTEVPIACNGVDGRIIDRELEDKFIITKLIIEII